MEGIKPYKKYKTSFIDGLDLIPDHWERWKLNRVLFFQEGPGLRTWQFKDDGVKVICVTNITPPVISFKKMTKYISVEEYEEKYKHFTVEKGNILLASSGATWGKVATFYSEEKVILNTSTIRLNTKKNEILTNSIVKHLLNADYVNTQLENLLTGSCQPNFGPTHLNKLYVALPPTSEQTAIANFLDYKTAKIDRFIFKKKQLIKLLNEQKAGIINDAVTKGINPNAKMKASGIEWLGDIPEDWEVRKLKYVAESVLGKMLCNEDKGGYSKKPYLKSKNIQWLKVDVSNVEEMWFSDKELIQYRLKKGDLVLSEGGEVGKTCLWNNEIEECYIQNSAHKVTVNSENLAKYYLYLFFLYGNKGAFDAITNKVSIGHLTKDKLINLKCLYPELSEQTAIVSHIEKETSIITKTIATIEKEIALVQEYRTALIAEAVTGKIDVREYKVPSFEADKEYAEMEVEMGLVAEDGEEIEIEN